MYIIEDRQIYGRLFADGVKFNTKEEVREQLISYHSNDCEDIGILENMTLNEVLDYGEWDIKEV